VSGGIPAGPYVALAVLCERVIEDKDGVLTLVRLIDRITVNAGGEDVPEELPPATYQFTAVIGFKSGSARGSYPVGIRPEAPSGQQLPTFTQTIHLEGEDRGANLIVNFGLTVEMPGLYWIDVLFRDEVVTRIPLRVIYQPQRVS
jgi:hypothetical protein